MKSSEYPWLFGFLFGLLKMLSGLFNFGLYLFVERYFGYELRNFDRFGFCLSIFVGIWFRALGSSHGMLQSIEIRS